MLDDTSLDIDTDADDGVSTLDIRLGPSGRWFVPFVVIAVVVVGAAVIRGDALHRGDGVADVSSSSSSTSSVWCER